MRQCLQRGSCCGSRGAHESFSVAGPGEEADDGVVRPVMCSARGRGFELKLEHPAPDATRERVIADVARAAYDAWSGVTTQ